MADLSKELNKELSKDFAYCEDTLGRAENAIGNLPSAQPEKRTKKRAETHACDLIDRQAAIDATEKKFDEIYKTKQKGATYPHDDFFQGMAYAENVVKHLPSAQPEIKPIGYQECANAMLKMWIDNVVTDGEYNRIMDKLNSYWRKNDG